MATNYEKEEDDEAFRKATKKYEEIVSRLPHGRHWMTDQLDLHQYKGYWLASSTLKGVIFIHDLFTTQSTDIFLATSPKTGTTWFRALIFTTMNRSRYEFSSHPLLNTGPHDCFPLLDSYISQNESISNLKTSPSPRLFSTHLPYDLFPKSITDSSCRFVYVCRNAKDVLVSKWFFMNKLRSKDLPRLSLEEAFELFCEGISHDGPFWDHVLGYWRTSLESPEKILFLKYEEMKREPVVHLKRLAEFLGQPFSAQEESEGVVREIIKLCSFKNLSNLEVNQNSAQNFSNQLIVDNRFFFRKGEVGDWKNHLTSEMIKCLDQITEEKLHGSGLTFHV
ncbi:flavonol sulfotransferase-like [Pistacia vera]|uniref:flavonol sulfotransferase-like n=1 Tax=Pistacia vera TaxID=55513 RepID=UPI001263A923|nr:flavonol sulfotransferase-like [Pistacia vera]